MKKIIIFGAALFLTTALAAGADSLPAPAATSGQAPSMNTAPPGDYWGIGGGPDFTIQNAGSGQHGVLALVSGRSLSPNFVGEGEIDGMAYNAGTGGLLDMRLFADVKLMPETPFVQPYGLLGFGFAGLLGVDANTPNLVSLDFIWGGGFRVELVRRIHLFLDYKMHILVRDYPTAIDSPLTGGLTFPL